MTMKPTMAPGMNLPGRRPATPPGRSQPQEQQFTETTKVDPASTFGIGKRKSPEQELMDNAEPIATPPPPRPLPEPQQVQQPEPPKPPKKAPLDELVDDDIISRIVQEYGLDPVVVHEANLAAPGLKKSLSVHFRTLTWDDYNWGLAALQQRAQSNQDTSYLQSDAQRSQFYRALTACRCVLKIDNAWVWDIFKLRSDIKFANPEWNGDTHIGVPEFFIGTIAQRVFDLFRKKLHYDLLFALDDAVRAAGEEQKPEDDNPTPAA